MIRSISHLLDMENGPWVAGGCIRRILCRADKDDYDIDVFFRDEAQLKAVSGEMRRIEKRVRGESEPAAETVWSAFGFKMAPASQCNDADKATGLMYERSNTMVPLQLISKYYFPTITALVEDFDFTICQMVTDGYTVHCPHRSINDLYERRLRISPTSSGVRHVARALRYFTYGFEPDETVMKLVETVPQGNYYDPQGGGYIPYDPIIARLISDDIEQQITLSKIGDIYVERDRGVGVAYIHGFPFPAPLAYIYLSCVDMRYHIEAKLAPLWEAKNLGAIGYSSRTAIGQKTFLDAYRRAYAQAGEA
jgi:hypothetical protein